MTEPLASSTTNGLPYPESTDRLNQGAVAMKALATALEVRGYGLRMELGALTGSSGERPLLPTDANGRGTFTFAKPFTTKPMLICAPGAIATMSWMVMIETVTLTGATILALYGDGKHSPAAGAVPFYYIAVGKDTAL